MRRSSRLPVVYIVDDDASIRESLARLMDAAGLEPKPFASIPEFLREVQGKRMACVLLDVARECEPAVRSAMRAVAEVLPVIALSSSDSQATRRMARELGARSFFRKPVDGAALLDSIQWVTQGNGRDAQI